MIRSSRRFNYVHSFVEFRPRAPSSLVIVRLMAVQLMNPVFRYRDWFWVLLEQQSGKTGRSAFIILHYSARCNLSLSLVLDSALDYYRSVYGRYHGMLILSRQETHFRGKVLSLLRVPPGYFCVSERWKSGVPDSVDLASTRWHMQFIFGKRSHEERSGTWYGLYIPLKFSLRTATQWAPRIKDPNWKSSLTQLVWFDWQITQLVSTMFWATLAVVHWSFAPSLVCCCTFICYDIALNIASEVNQCLNHCPTTCVDDTCR